MRLQGKWPWAILALFALLGVAAGRFATALVPPRAVVAAGIALPLDSRNGFYQALDLLEQRVLGTPIQLVVEGTSWSVMGLELGVRLDRAAMWEDVAGRRPGETALAQFFRLRLSKPGPRRVDLHLTYDSARLDAYLGTLGAQYWQPPRNARINTAGVIEPAASGRSFDVPGTRQRLLEAWRRGLPTIGAEVHPVQPVTTAKMLSDLSARYTIARFSSYFDSTKEGRVDNIRMAARLLDGVVIKPDEEFSFNNVVGPRTLERGFKVAEEIVNQELVPGIGGGVCQVSSTLYNAILLSGLKVIQRQNHSRPLGYVPIGRDATVYYGVIDFRFRNPYGFPLVLATEVNANRLTVAVHTPRKPDVEFAILVTDVVELPSGEEVVQDTNVPPGQVVIAKSGLPGWQVRTWRVALSNMGEELYREEVSNDRYPPQPTVVQVNPGSFRPGEPSKGTSANIGASGAANISGAGVQGDILLSKPQTTPVPFSVRPNDTSTVKPQNNLLIPATTLNR